jgi:hypothetical protein
VISSDALAVILAAFLLVSVVTNIYQWYRWHSYRTKPAGTHSHTGMMPKVDRNLIEKHEKRKEGGK